MINPRLKKAFEKYIEEENKPKTTYYGGCYNGTYQYSSQYPSQYDCTIFFYEWSNLRSGAKHFKQKEEFFKYLDECNIKYTEIQKKEIEDAKYKNVFATCKPNKAELIKADTWYQLNNIVTSFVEINKPSEN